MLGQQTPLCPTSRRGPRHSLTTPLPEAPELVLNYLRERGPAAEGRGEGNEGRRWAGLEEREVRREKVKKGRQGRRWSREM